jgi:hypothetical protein
MLGYYEDLVNQAFKFALSPIMTMITRVKELLGYIKIWLK